MFVVTEKELSPQELISQVVDGSCGAVVTFIGTVRNNSKGKTVRYLEYEAYREMAEAEMRKIGEEIQERWSDVRIAIAHRTGTLAIGDISVVIAVASPHRKEAFEACRYAIEHLKKTVPIWKKEVFDDGEVWVE